MGLLKKKQRVPCTSCGRAIDAAAKTCSCGVATQNMSFDERRAYEVERWRSYQQQTA